MNKIILIVGDFGVGKDTVADLLLKNSQSHNDCLKFKKIKSYATRETRYENEDTHIFCSKSEFLSFNDFIAQTQIGEHYYGARKSQFTAPANLYCVDDKGVKDIIESGEKPFIIEIIRPSWLINIPEERKNRKRHSEPYKFKSDYRIINDGDMAKLETSVLECYRYIVKELKKPS